MNRYLLALSFVVACCGLAPLFEPTNSIPGHYIVVFSVNASTASVHHHLAKVDATVTYDMPTFRGYAGKFVDSMLSEIRADPAVAYVERDSIRTAVCINQANAIWGLDRTAKNTPGGMDGRYNYDETSAGAGVDAYVIDTGIRTTHNEFSGGRAIWGTNTVDSQNSDCNGHGTHVAGTVGGTTYGIAKRVTLIAVKVLNCQGSGSTAGVINGVNWAVNNQRTRRRPSVANMSLGGGYSRAMNDAADAMVNAGITLAVAAGNENSDACNTSPASATRVITVGSTALQSSVDARSSFSNFGSCLHIFAPGSSILSAYHTSNTATATLSGTSMASPHVAGAAAVLLSQAPSSTPVQILRSLQASSGKDLIRLDCTKSGCASSPNQFLKSRC